MKSKEELSKIEFFEIKDEALITKFLSTILANSVVVTFWTKNQTIKFETKCKEYLQRIRRLTFEVPSELAPEKLTQTFSEQGSPQILGSFQLQTVNFFFKTSFVSLLEGNSLMQLAIPKEIYKLQRRTSLRIVFDRKDAPVLKFFDPKKSLGPLDQPQESDLLSFRVLDLSNGGLGFAAPMELKETFIKGIKLFKMQFQVRGKLILATGKIMHIRESHNEQAQPILKIGVQFLDLKGDYERWIELFVMDENREMFSLIFSE